MLDFWGQFGGVFGPGSDAPLFCPVGDLYVSRRAAFLDWLVEDCQCGQRGG